MCGLFGLIKNTGLTPIEIQRGNHALAKLTHRGPDNQRTWLSGNKKVFLGHTRLAVIDTSSKSDQPWISGESALIFNGEIYNFIEHRNYLESKQCVFETVGDVEVLFKSLEILGLEKTLDMLDFMGAFIYVNEMGVHLVTDPFGEKPLYFKFENNFLAFSSELNALRDFCELELELTEEKIASVMALGFCTGSQTIFKNTHKLSPGTILKLHSDGKLNEKKYYTPPIFKAGTQTSLSFSKAELNHVKDALISSTERRLRADVKKCLFLSSGVDSSLMASLISLELSEKIDCLTGFNKTNDIELIEVTSAKRVADYLGFEQIPISLDERANTLPFEILGEPSGNTGVFPLESLSKEARLKGFTVGLCGMGGDEVSMGYAKYNFLWKYRKLISSVPLAKNFNFGVFSDSKIARLLSLIFASKNETYVAQKNYPCLFVLRGLPGYKAWLTKTFSSSKNSIEFNAFFELTQVMPRMQLLSADHASMLHGFELRTPYLNREVVRAIANIDSGLLYQTRQKHLLRTILAQYLPEELIERRKLGFTHPYTTSISLGEKRNFLPSSAVKRIALNKCSKNGWRDLSRRLEDLDHFLSANY